VQAVAHATITGEQDGARPTTQSLERASLWHLCQGTRVSSSSSFGALALKKSAGAVIKTASRCLHTAVVSIEGSGEMFLQRLARGELPVFLKETLAPRVRRR
jgi:hypothetical protein